MSTPWNMNETIKFVSELAPYINKQGTYKLIVDFGVGMRLLDESFDVSPDIDRWESQLTPDCLKDLTDHMEKLSKHEAFFSGRTYFFEGYHTFVNEKSKTIKTLVVWGS